ncbi:hypothetical protein [Cellulomonas iranensis]|uniref:hypothetical protein n=1 Tax=Cellulomonas iranensis TaxID=76862 RepID=UPI0013CF8A21|nr:hypothetical protein [Cellulomonas iranensis]
MDTTPVTPRSRVRAAWAVPAVAVVAVGAAFAAPPLLASADTAGLPTVQPDELVTRVLEAEPQALSGTVVHTARLGLPDLSLVQVGGADPVSLLGGSTTLRVWTDGEARSRVSLLGTASEYSAVTDGTQAWTYSSSDDEVVHYALSRQDAARAQALRDDPPTPPADLPTPAELGRQALERAQQDATVSVDAATKVAGRDAYQVVVTPTSTTTLVGRIVVAVDARTWTPLRVQVWSSDDAQTPALEVGFTDVTFAAPADSVLTFTPPPGAQVREVTVPLPDDATLAAHGDVPSTLPDDPADAPLPDGVTVTGTGWDAVVEVSDVDVAALLAGDPSAVASLPDVEKSFGGGEGANQLFDQFMGEGDGPPVALDTATLYDQLTTPVEGGRALQSSLLSVLVLDDGRVLAGAVPVDTLRAVAGA